MADHVDVDHLLALALQSKYNNEVIKSTKKCDRTGTKRLNSPIQINDDEVSPAKKHQTKSLIDPEWEVKDPTPDIHSLFMKFNRTFFWGTLNAVEVRWSPRMYSCAGVCSYEGRRGLCSVRLSEPLLKLRPRSDLVETLLHEMIHAYLFITNNNKDRDGHGPEFKKHMYRINAAAGTNISIYHNFHDEVKLYQKHWWRCDGHCRNTPPFYGMVKRSMNRKPGPSDFWWTTHQATCGGTFIKVREPDKTAPKGKNKYENVRKKTDIRNFFPKSPTGSSNQILSVTDLNKYKGSSGGAIKKIPSNSSSAISGKGVIAKPNRVVGFKDLSNQSNSNKAVRNIFNGQGNKLGTVGKGNYNSGGTAVMNKGTGTLTVKPKLSNKTETKVKNETKTVGNFVPFSGSGNKLGNITTHRVNGNSKPISPLVFSLERPSKTETTKVSPEKYKNDFFNVTLSDDELAKVDEATGCQSKDRPFKSKQKNVRTNTIISEDLKSPEKYKDDFLNITISDDELADLEEEKICNNPNNYSPEKYRDTFLSKSNSDDDLGELDVNDDHFRNKDEVSCPVCSLKIYRDDMSIHLQSCDILNSTIESMSNSEVLDSDDEEDHQDDKTGRNLTQSDIVFVSCPCCSKDVKENEVNQHLDECLSLLAIKEFDKDF